MSNFTLNRHELSQYGLLQELAKKLDKSIKEIENELAELDKYNISISPTYTGMPSGNEIKDKVADFVIKLNSDRLRLQEEYLDACQKRYLAKDKLYKIEKAVNQIQNRQLRDIITAHYLQEKKICDIAKENYVSVFAIYKRLNRFFKDATR